jgi:arylsulfatase A-like enzyme
MSELEAQGVLESTLVLFASDNGPWLTQGLAGGSAGLFTGRYANYYDTGKGSYWEGGIRSPFFAYWKGTIPPMSRSSEVVSSLDVLPTLLTLAGVPIPSDRVIDGRDFSDLLFSDAAKSKHEFLFFYNRTAIVAARLGPYKAHWFTASGFNHSAPRVYCDKYPLLFNVDRDPSETSPVCEPNTMPTDPSDKDAMERIVKAYAAEKATFTFGTLVPEPDGPGEGRGRYGLCCDRSRGCNCGASDVSDDGGGGILNLGTKQHHDRYHAILGEDEPSPPVTQAQALLNRL